MVFDWNNPIGLGLFFLICAVAVAALAFSLWLVGKTLASLPARRNRR